MKMLLKTLTIFFSIFFLVYRGKYVYAGVLYPRASEARQVRTLDGLWSFSILNDDGTPSDNSLSGNPNDKDLYLMSVPSSYNDILTSFEGKEHVGLAKYEREFFIPASWLTNRIWLRFGSVCYAAEVYLNDQLVVSHEIGHLPFEAEITQFLDSETKKYKISVIVNNTLTYTTIPQGYVNDLSSGRKQQHVLFDFYNYAGIDRSVYIYKTEANTRIEDLTITTNIQESTGLVNYDIEIDGEESVTYAVTVLDKDKNSVASSNSQSGTINIPNANFWWPYLMNDDPGYLYTLQVDLLSSSGDLIDRYAQPFGIRELQWSNTSLLINGKKIYIRGLGRHEDSYIHGKGLDLPLIIRDHNLLRWLGANAYRTSHYPYAEEIMDLADSLGIMIIDEVPAVNTQKYSDELLQKHKQAVKELYTRDKNRPSVTIWSLANEPQTAVEEAENHYREVVGYMKSFDTTRPVTVVNFIDAARDLTGQFLDIICFNRYDGWYGEAGNLSSIIPMATENAYLWNKLHNKPVILSEYGAETFDIHALPSSVWSDEYLQDVMNLHFLAFDELRQNEWFIGEMIWNFADFSTMQNIKRLGGNRKGMFTRDRQPKAGAYILRKRYWDLAAQLDNAKKPANLDPYIVNSAVSQTKNRNL